MSSSFKNLEEPKSTSVVEIDGVILSQTDTLPTNFDRKKHAPLIVLKASSPLYSTRIRHRASVLLARDSLPPWLGPWRLLYYLEYIRIVSTNAYYTVQRLRSTPGDLLLKYFLGRSLSIVNPLLTSWPLHEERSRLSTLLGTPSSRMWNKKRSGEEKIEHIAFHPSIQILALSTTFSRIHLFDLRTNVFLDYYMCAADSPADLTITSLAFNGANQLAVGMDTGCVDIWTLDLSTTTPGSWTLTSKPEKALGSLFTPVRSPSQLSGSPFGYRSSQPPMKHSTRRPTFFSTHPSPGTQDLLAKDARREGAKTTLERVELVKNSLGTQEGLIGGVTVVAFSPSGKHLAVGTTIGGVWVYNVTLETSFRVLPHFALLAVAAKCTALTWGVPPGVRSVPLRGEEDLETRYQLETAHTTLIAGMESGLVVYLRVRENGAGGITIDSHPVEFYPGILAGVSVGGGIGQILLVPSPLDTDSRQYGSFPTFFISIRDEPGVHIFRLVPDSVLKASVPSASSVPNTPVHESFTFKRSSHYHGRRIYKKALRATGKFLGDYCGVYDRMRAVHVGSLDTEYTVFPPTIGPLGEDVTGLGAGETTQYCTPHPMRSGGYGGVVQSMAIDPTGQRLIVSFTHQDRGMKSEEESVVWFDASSITSSAFMLEALGVVRPERVITRESELGGVGEVGFAGGFDKGVCAGIVVGGGMGVGIFRGSDSDGEGERWVSVE